MIPFNLAKRFIGGDSYVSGILIDYLIPTLYVTDIIIFSILLLWFFDAIKNKKKHVIPANIFVALLLALLFFIVLGLASTTLPSYLKTLKLLEMFLLMLYAFFNFKLERDVHLFFKILSFSVLFESFVAFIQFLKRASVFNNYLFFGELPYTYKTPGIVFENFFGKMVIPPYGTFPHPNVLGGFLAVSLILIFYYLLTRKVTVLSVCAFFYGILALTLTVSFSAYAAFLLGVLGIILVKVFGRRVLKPLFLLILFLNFFLPFVLNLKSFESFSSFYRRKDLLDISRKMILDKPFLGVGTGLFTKNLENYGNVRGVLKFFEPVHNIFFLIASEAGVFAVVIFVLFLSYVFDLLLAHSSTSIFLISLCQLLFLGMFDHYLLTYQQGLLLFWLTLGVALSTIVVNAKNNAQFKG